MKSYSLSGALLALLMTANYTAIPAMAAGSAPEISKEILYLTDYSQQATLSINYEGEITWLSSDPNVVTVDQGTVTAVGNGSAVIYAISADRRAEMPVQVSYHYTLSDAEITLTAQEMQQIFLYSDATGNQMNPIAEWNSSDTAVATVDENGVITAISAGSAVITATAGDVSASCTVTVNANPEKQDPVTAAETLHMTEYHQQSELSLNYDGEILWSSSDPSVATVENGIVTSIGNGSAVITATCGEAKLNINVEVNYDYYLSETEISLSAGTKKQLMTYSQNSGNAVSVPTVWSVSDPQIVEIDENGVVTALSTGTAEISAVIGDVSCICNIIVTDPPEVQNLAAEVKQGQKMQLSVTNYTGSVTWISSDPTIASVSADGVLTAIKSGETTVAAMLEDGRNLIYQITVIPDTSAFTPGDVNQDGTVNIMDVILVNKAIYGKADLSEDQLKAADVNHDEKPDATDSLMIMKYIIKLIANFD